MSESIAKSEEVRRQKYFYLHYEGPSQTSCPLMVGVVVKNPTNALCNCEPLRQKVADQCGVGGKCPVQEYYFANPSTYWKEWSENK